MTQDNDKDTETEGLRQKLRDQAERLDLALEAASMGTWEHVPGTRATCWDARSKAIFGLPPEAQLTFDAYVAAIHPADREQVFAGINKAMDPASGRECSLQYRIKVAGERETWRWVEAHGRCTFVDGVPGRINGTLLDITERRQAEEAVREATRRKDEFMAVLGHELRNPLAPIRTALDLMQVRYPDHAVVEREVIDRQVKHMIRLVDDLLDLARVARGTVTLKRDVSELALALQHAVEIASPLFEAKKHHLEMDVPPGLLVSVDAVRFSQVITNLLANAARFTPPGGRIGVRARRRDAEVEIEIVDSGAGIEAEQLERIFEPFIQVSRDPGSAHGGLGIGLSLVRDLMALHGGSVAAQSAGLGRGSRFVLRLPLSTEEVALRPAAAYVSAPPARSLKILVVDDNQDATRVMALLLTDRGHKVHTAANGMQALAIASAFQPEVAVLDLGLPVMDGYELAGRLIETLAPRPIRIVAITGYGQTEDRERTRAAGFALHLVKPVELQELEAALG